MTKFVPVPETEESEEVAVARQDEALPNQHVSDLAHYDHLSDLEDSPDGGDSDLEDSPDEPDYETESEAPSDAYEDVEASSEDDIFEVRDQSKHARKERLTQRKRNARRKKINLDKQGKSNTREVVAEDWYSDADGDENFDELLSNEQEGPKFGIFKKGDSVKHLKLHEGIEFDDVKLYKDTLTDWSVLRGFVIDFIKCEAKRVTAVCAYEGCGWRIHASVKQNSSLFQVKTLKGEHNCPRASENYRASASYIAKKLEQTIREHPDVRPPQLQNIVSRKLGIDITYPLAVRAKKIAQKNIRGEDEKEFAILWDYCATLKSTDPGSTVYLKKIEGVEPPTFEQMYFFRTTCKSDVFNNMILPARELPVVSMFEWIRLRLMPRIQVKKEGMEKFQGNICPNVMKKLNKQLEHVRFCGRMEFEVASGEDNYVVRLDQRSCTCGMFRMTMPQQVCLLHIMLLKLLQQEFVLQCVPKMLHQILFAGDLFLKLLLHQQAQENLQLKLDL